MAVRQKVRVNSSLLKWARENSGFTPEEAAYRASVPVDVYRSWEEVTADIPFGKLKALARAFKRQIAVFFLPEVPVQKIAKPKDYRNLTVSFTALSPEVVLSIRRANAYQEVAREVRGDEYWRRKFSWREADGSIATPKTEQSLLATTPWLREALQISLDSQRSWVDSSTAFRTWRSAVEERLGIIVCQFGMPENEVQGFCLTDQLPNVIVVNNRLPFTNRIFTIFHELGHIMLKQSGLCLIDEEADHQRLIERNCNRFAAEFLLPEGEIEPANTLEELMIVADLFKVSREVYLRRLHELKIITDNRFFILLKSVTNSYQTKREAPKRELRIPREVISRSTRGNLIYDLVLDGVRSQKVGISEASSLLGLRPVRVANEL